MSAVIYDITARRTARECPGTTLAEHAITDLAAALARDPGAMTDSEVTAVLKRQAHPSLTEQDRNDLFDGYCHAIRRLHALDAGWITWEDVRDDLTCPDRTQAAREYLDDDASRAMDRLLNGSAHGGDAA